MAGPFIDPYAGPPGGQVRPWQRPGVAAYVIALLVVAATIAFIVGSNRADDDPVEPRPPTVTRPAP